LVLLALMAMFTPIVMFTRTNPDRVSSTERVSASTAEPDEPCRVEAPVEAQRAAQSWCQEGIFTRVNVSQDARNFVVVLQFSNKGLRGWTNAKYTVLNRFRQVTDEMVEKSDMNVAFSLYDTNGQMVGGCARRRGARESRCQ
jgi:2-keto-3-deoxy-L-rhamnonate aldolase RhmA